MKLLLTFLIITLTFTSCVQKNGFSNFSFTPEQELWENNSINARIVNKEGIQGTINAVYLNKVMPQKYSDQEYFYVSVYLKHSFETLEFFLNDTPSVSVKKLQDDELESFKEFLVAQNQWRKYYLVSFPIQEDVDVLSLITKNKNITSSTMMFKKDE